MRVHILFMTYKVFFFCSFRFSSYSYSVETLKFVDNPVTHLDAHKSELLSTQSFNFLIMFIRNLELPGG
ncbi:hypothetical protein HanIR_Chr02g0053211 [Helianthus annuus]|nr:hypothetical protein HanIR_Chr02g0053211 [Helianthus annuus]KAJ0617415.1 hypothetical protein HanHA89_Chr02g0041681 [Helianthus annuus]KAJ0775955.1 hypothetical protein HanLR1_Chr02g0040231 [Helianthus annuus]